MYNRVDSDFNETRNEIAIQNLIMIATNDRLFNKLDTNTQIDLLNFVKAYTSANLNAIKDTKTLASSDTDTLLVEELNKLR